MHARVHCLPVVIPLTPTLPGVAVGSMVREDGARIPGWIEREQWGEEVTVGTRYVTSMYKVFSALEHCETDNEKLFAVCAEFAVALIYGAMVSMPLCSCRQLVCNRAAVPLPPTRTRAAVPSTRVHSSRCAPRVRTRVLCAMRHDAMGHRSFVRVFVCSCPHYLVHRKTATRL